jgi:hypothetical protein
LNQEASFATKIQSKDHPMSTPAQAEANLANAQHSTGPRTETGKAASSQNALKHGLTAKTILLPGEDAYRKMCEGMFEKFAPACTPEQELVQLLCDTQWRLSAAGVSKPPSSPPMRRTSKLSTS